MIYIPSVSSEGRTGVEMTVEFEDPVNDNKLVPMGQRMMQKLIQQNNTLLINGTTYMVKPVQYSTH